MRTAASKPGVGALGRAHPGLGREGESEAGSSHSQPCWNAVGGVGGRARSARLPITGGGGGGGGGLLEEVRREVVELRLPAAGDREPRSAPSQAAPSGAGPVPDLAAPRARSPVQPEPWGRSRSEHHGAGGLVPLGAPPRPPAPRSHGHPRWVWLGEGAGRCGCAHGRPEQRGPVSATAGRSGAMGRFRLLAPRAGRGSE